MSLCGTQDGRSSAGLRFLGALDIVIGPCPDILSFHRTHSTGGGALPHPGKVEIVYSGTDRLSFTVFLA